MLRKSILSLSFFNYIDAFSKFSALKQIKLVLDESHLVLFLMSKEVAQKYLFLFTGGFFLY